MRKVLCIIFLILLSVDVVASIKFIDDIASPARNVERVKNCSDAKVIDISYDRLLIFSTDNELVEDINIPVAIIQVNDKAYEIQMYDFELGLGITVVMDEELFWCDGPDGEPEIIRKKDMRKL